MPVVDRCRGGPRRAAAGAYSAEECLPAAECYSRPGRAWKGLLAQQSDARERFSAVDRFRDRDVGRTHEYGELAGGQAACGFISRDPVAVLGAENPDQFVGVVAGAERGHARDDQERRQSGNAGLRSWMFRSRRNASSDGTKV